MSSAPAWFLACGVLWAAGGSYSAGIEDWRRQRETELKADGGWLTVTGLFWLHEGSNEIALPVEPVLNGRATFILHHGKVSMRRNGQNRDMRDAVTIGSLTLIVIERGGRYGIRLKDNESRLRKEFTGLHYFPIDASYCVTARFVADSKKIPILNILGQIEDMPSPGYVEFDLRGRHLRLTPVEESPDELFFILRDLTAGKDTYGSGRFLHTPLPKNGRVILDFNKTYNPPCAFTPYATCPLPPRENRLPVRIEAGELKYGSH